MRDTIGFDIEKYVESIDIKQLAKEIENTQIASSIAFNILQRYKGTFEQNHELFKAKIKLLRENEELKVELEKRKEFMKSAANLYIN